MNDLRFSQRFQQQLRQIIETAEIVIDRPKGSGHPRHRSVTYPLDYGYLKGTGAIDGDGIDVWIGTLPSRRLTGVICTVDGQKRDAEVKALLGCTAEEIDEILRFHNRGDQAAVVVVYHREL
ncbi:MAG: inorganic pyrophosphatase [Anaerolineae bacterium]